MLKEVYLKFDDSNFDFRKVKHIQYNLCKRLIALKYVSYNRIDIYIHEKTDSDGKRENIHGENSQRLTIDCFVLSEVIKDLVARESIISIYEAIIGTLVILWNKKGWQASDLFSIQSQIESEDYKSAIKVESLPSSPNRKIKVNFAFEVFPNEAYYFLEVHDKSSNTKRIKFFEGDTVLESFLIFFNNRNWVDNNTFSISNASEEIFFIFNLTEVSFNITYRPNRLSLKQCKNQLKSLEPGLTIQDRIKLLNGDSI